MTTSDDKLTLWDRIRMALYDAILRVTIWCGFRYSLVREFPDGTHEEWMRFPWLFPITNAAMGAQAAAQEDARNYDGSVFKVIDTREARS